ncbi:Uncharacterised protein [Vibrio cholerae]|nr:Uncharacterised protein [Vibrio cholerae]
MALATTQSERLGMIFHHQKKRRITLQLVFTCW